MNTDKRIKREWGSLSIKQDDSAIVGVTYNNKPCCLYFESTKQLKEAIHTRQLSVKNWAVCVPRSLCILKRLNLPTSSLDEAVRMTEFELRSLAPIPRDKISYGCTLLTKHENMLEVLVSILKTDTLNSYLQPYESIGINPHKVVLSSLAIQRWSQTLIDKTESAAEIMVLVENSSCVIQCNVNGNLYKAQTLKPPNENMNVYIREITKEVLHCQNELSNSSNKEVVVLTAGLERFTSEIRSQLIANLGDSLADRVKVIPTPKITSYRKSGKSNALNHDTITVAGLLDLVTGSELSHFNLLPRKKLKRHAQKALVLNCAWTGSLCVLFILLAWLCLWGMNWRVERHCRLIRSQIAPIEHVASSVEKKRKQVGAIRNQLANRGQIRQIIKELYKYTPHNISISELNFAATYDGGSLRIKGQADTLSNAFSYTEAMLEAALLNKLQIENAQQVTKAGGSIVEFRANCKVKNSL